MTTEEAMKILVAIGVYSFDGEKGFTDPKIVSADQINKIKDWCEKLMIDDDASGETLARNVNVAIATLADSLP